MSLIILLLGIKKLHKSHGGWRGNLCMYALFQWIQNFPLIGGRIVNVRSLHNGVWCFEYASGLA
jgi:hypothetical protein